MVPSPSCSPGRTGPLWSRSCGPSLARTEVEDAGVKEISFEISSSLVPCTILLNPAAAHRRGCATMPYTRTFAARLSVVYPMTLVLASPVRNLICHTGPVKLPARRSGLYGATRWKCGYRRVDAGWGAPVAGRTGPRGGETVESMRGARGSLRVKKNRGPGDAGTKARA